MGPKGERELPSSFVGLIEHARLTQQPRGLPTSAIALRTCPLRWQESELLSDGLILWHIRLRITTY